MDPHKKRTIQADSILHRQPRLYTAQLPVFYCLHFHSFNSKGQINSFTRHVFVPNVVSPKLSPPSFFAYFYRLPSFSRATSVFDQVNKKSCAEFRFCRARFQASCGENPSAPPSTSPSSDQSEESEYPLKMARASAKFISASDLDSDGDDGPLVSLMGKLSVERKPKAQCVEYTRDSIVVDQSSVGISCNLGPGNLEAVLACGDRPSYVRMNPRPETRGGDSTSPKRPLEAPGATAAAQDAASGPPPEPMDQGGEEAASI